jgi:hypothetical protein
VETYREPCLGPLSCSHRPSRETASHERECPRREDRFRTARSGDRTRRATGGQSEVLHAIANSPDDLQPIFDAILDSATRLCRADIGGLRLSEESGLRRVAMRGDPLVVSQALSSFPGLAEKGSFLSQLATRKLPTHIPDLTALEGDRRDDYWTALVNAGLRTHLLVPLLKENGVVGIIALGRKQMQPFTD